MYYTCINVIHKLKFIYATCLLSNCLKSFVMLIANYGDINLLIAVRNLMILLYIYWIVKHATTFTSTNIKKKQLKKYKHVSVNKGFIYSEIFTIVSCTQKVNLKKIKSK